MNRIKKQKNKKKKKGAVAILCMLCVTFIGLIGCDANGSLENVDAATFLRNLEASPVQIAPDLPEKWLNERVEEIIPSYLQFESGYENPIVVYKGEWNKRTVYYIWHAFSSSLGDAYYEDGEELDFTKDNNYCVEFMSKSKNWIVIWKYVPNVIPNGFTD